MDLSLEINFIKNAEEICVTINSKIINSSNSFELEKLFSELARMYNIKIDLLKVELIQSSGIGALIAINKIAKQNDTTVTLLNLNEITKDIFKNMKLDTIFKII